MAGEIDSALRSVAEQIAKYVADAVEMRVTTSYVVVEPDSAGDFATAKAIAQTIVKLDGDCESIIPMRIGANGALEIDIALRDMHEQTVRAATEYRAKILQSLVAALPARIR